MAEPFIGEIRPFGFDFAPVGWALCNGQVMLISENQALYSILGTTYGGNGVTTFALPNLQGRAPVHQGPGKALGMSAGSESVTLTLANLPQHNHLVNAATGEASSADPTNNAWATTDSNPYIESANGTMAAGAIGNTGGSQAHNNMQPYLTINFCIAVQGLFPSRN